MNKKITIFEYKKFNKQFLRRFYNLVPLNFLIDENFIKFKNIFHKVSVEEINKIYLPISLLLNVYISLKLRKKLVLRKIFSNCKRQIPYIIGVTGSVAVGKSVTANLLKVLLSQLPEQFKVDLVATDGFLYPNKVLDRKNIIGKKGFPQSYDIIRLKKFIDDIQSGINRVFVPVYSHFNYDIIPFQKRLIKNPDVIILEGLNILQNNVNCSLNKRHIFFSDFVDFSIYIDASENLLEQWYIKRFLNFSKKSISNSNAYFYRYSKFSRKEIIQIAKIIWKKVNRTNLRNNIIPFKKKARLIITKGLNHVVKNVKLKK